MTRPEDLPFSIQGRRLIAETAGLRVQILTLAAGEDVPWHSHTRVTDTFICLDGPMVVMTASPDADIELGPGDDVAVPPNVAHRVAGRDGGPCRFAVVQGIGEHDFVTVEGRDS